MNKSENRLDKHQRMYLSQKNLTLLHHNQNENHLHQNLFCNPNQVYLSIVACAHLV